MTQRAFNGLALRVKNAIFQGDIDVCLSGKGKYGRWLGTLFDGTTDINQQLVDEGHAHDYDGGKRKAFGQ